jgi:hypothetical protein
VATVAHSTCSLVTRVTCGTSPRAATTSGSVFNQLTGDAQLLLDSARGGNDALIGGNATAGSVENFLYGDALGIDNAGPGGNDKLTGGNASGSGTVNNTLMGDAAQSYSAKGGNDTLTAGSYSGGGSVRNDMWGDMQLLLGSATGGHDKFVFKGDFVGTQNYIYDFHQSQFDKIEFSGVTGVTSFSDLTIAHSGLDTVITAGADQVTLVSYDNTAHPLAASDFLFA